MVTRTYLIKGDKANNGAMIIGSPTGDHIDLWNGETLTAASLQGRINNFLRFTIGLGSAWYSNLAESKKILLWEIK